jgi:hypothetical protein
MGVNAGYAIRWSRLLLVGALILWGVSGRATAARVSLCGPSLVDIQGGDACFPPSKVALVEHRMPVPPIYPAGVVWRLARLRLNEVELRGGRHPFGIGYLFGHISEDSHGVADLASRRTRYVIVGEVVEHLPLARGRLGRDSNGIGFYWSFDANFRCHHLTLDITSNEPARVVRQIAVGILALEGCGK